MRVNRVLTVFAVIAASYSLANAQPAQPGPNNKAVNSAGENNANAPVRGANSFTEDQAKSRIEDAGYTDVTGLKKDNDGVWRAMANKGGAQVSVSVDFQGNVNSSK